jgi:hypothetical protein
MRLLLLATIALGFSCPHSAAQDVYSIRVEPHQVVVPTFVFVRDLMRSRSQKEQNCDLANAEAFYKLRLSDPYRPVDCDETVMRHLTAADFRLFEDGVEQKIQDVTLQRLPVVHARDSNGWRTLFSATPDGFWSTRNLGPLLVPGDKGYRDSTGWHPSFYYAVKPADRGPSYTPGGTAFFYRIAYVPPASQEGSCHAVKVEVIRPGAFVFARSQYCNVPDAPTDPLRGTALGKQLLSDASSRRKGSLEMWMKLRTATFWTATHRARVDIALTVPWNKMRHEWKHGRLVASIGVLGLVYDQQGKQVMRFSDFGCCSDDRPDYLRGKHTNGAEPELDPTVLPASYETQIELPPGEYKLRVVLGDGESFGLADSLFSIEPDDPAALAVTSLILCDRFRNASAAEKEDNAASLAPLYVPLVSRGAQFYPVADPRNLSGQRLFVYFDVEDARVLDGSTKVRMQMKIAQAKHGEVAFDSGPVDLSSWFAAGSSVAHVADEIKVDNLQLGSYRIEVQASDSAGRTSAVRSVSFAVE